MEQLKNGRETPEEKYQFLTTRIRQFGILFFIVVFGAIFIPPKIMRIFSSKRQTHHNYNDKDPSIFVQEGMNAVYIGIAIFIVVILLLMIFTGWFRLRKRRKII
jgi:hypothetical protein